jgi:hypothetical protein
VASESGVTSAEFVHGNNIYIVGSAGRPAVNLTKSFVIRSDPQPRVRPVVTISTSTANRNCLLPLIASGARAGKAWLMRELGAEGRP